MLATIDAASPQPSAVASARPETSPIAHPVRQCNVAEIAVRLRLSTPHQPADGGHQLFGALLLAALGVADDAMPGVVVEQAERHLVERRLHGRDLGEDVDAVALVLD